MAEISVGIDLGTTNSTASTCWPEGHPRLIRDDEGSGIIPSVVSFDETGDLFVGREAKLRMLTDQKNTFYSVKRFLGRDMRKDENRWAASQYPFMLKAGPNGIPMAVTRGREIPAFKISSHVITYLKEMAEKSTGHKVTKAVLTVPANFNESQRKVTKQAGEDAGMEILRIFNEPTAA
ncbi:MAG: Hsp70 family protein, partial [Pseudomonadota bacterium]